MTKILIILWLTVLALSISLLSITGLQTFEITFIVSLGTLSALTAIEAEKHT